MARAETLVQLTEELRERLDAEAARRGVSRSSLIRDAVEAYLDATGDDAVTRAIVRGYRRKPQATLDEWGSVAEAVDESTAELLRRLDEEERKARVRKW